MIGMQKPVIKAAPQSHARFDFSGLLCYFCFVLFSLIVINGVTFTSVELRQLRGALVLFH